MMPDQQHGAKAAAKFEQKILLEQFANIKARVKTNKTDQTQAAYDREWLVEQFEASLRETDECHEVLESIRDDLNGCNCTTDRDGAPVDCHQCLMRNQIDEVLA
jgi:hypothetical protein